MYISWAAMATNSLVTSRSSFFIWARWSKILLQDLGDGDIVDADFVFRDQVEQQIQRPIKRIQMIGHLLCGHGSDHPKQAQQAADAPDDQVEHIDLQRGH